MISEDDQADYRLSDAEERERNRLFRLGQRGGPDAAEPCERCDGKGELPMFVTRDMAIDAGDIEMQGQEIATAACHTCLGTGVQP